MKIGYTLALALVVVIIAVALFASPTRSEPIKSNMQLLGEVTTVTDSDDKLAAELRADDERNNRK